MSYDAFVSYSHAADGRLAPALQAGMQALAKPWHRRRALRVFRDKSSLSASPELWPAIEDALSESRFFVLLTSPDAAASRWVEEEVSWWRANRSHYTVLIALTDGELRWDEARGDFDPRSAVPPGLRGWFPVEPLWVDLRWARDKLDVSMRNPRFRDSVGELAAPLHGVPKDELIGEDIRQHRRARRLSAAAIAGLLVLTLAAATFGVVAIRQRNEAREARDLAVERQRMATSRQLSTEALTNLKASGPRSLLLGLQALAVRDTMEARNVVLRALQEHSRLDAVLPAPGGTSLAWSPDAGLLAAGDGRGRVTVWDARTHEPSVRRFVADRRGVYSLAFSTDGRTLFTGGGGGNLRQWDARTGALRRNPPAAHRGEIWTVAVSPDGRAVASSGDDRFATVWELPSRQVLRRLTTEDAFRMRSVAFSPDGRTLASGDWLGALRLWDRATGRLTGRRSEDGSGLIGTVGFHPRTGELVACGTSDATVYSVGAGSLDPVARLSGIGDLSSCAIDPVSTTLAAGRLDGSVVLWDWSSGSKATLRAQAGRVAALAFAPGARSLAALVLGGDASAVRGEESTVAIWDLRGERGLGRTVAAGASAADADARGRLVAVGHQDGTVSTVDGRTGRQLQTCRPSVTGRVTDVALESGTVAIASDRGEVAFCAASSGARIGRAVRDPNEFAITGIDLTSDGELAVWSSEDRRVVVWDRRAGRRLATRKFFDPIDRVGVDVAGSPTVTVRGAAWVWNDGRLAQKRGGGRSRLQGAVRTTALTPAGRVAAAADAHAPRIRLWDLSRNEALGAPLVPTGPAAAAMYAADLSFSGDGRALAATYDNGAVVLWDTDPRSWAARACTIVRPVVRYGPEGLLPGREVREECW